MSVLKFNKRVNLVKASTERKPRKRRKIRNTKNAYFNKWVGMSLYGVFLSIFPALALADVSDSLNNLLSYLTGDLGKTVAMLAIVGFGYACFKMHKVEKSTFLYIVVGIGIIFGAKTLLAMITG